MTALALRVLWVSLTTSAVLVPLLLLAGPICRRYRAKSCYVLWLVLALRLLIPVEIPLPQAPVTVEVPVVELTVLDVPQTGEKASAQTPEQPPVLQPAPVGRAISPVEVLGLVWICGVVFLMAAQWVNYSTIKKTLWKNSWEKPEDQAVLTQLGGTIPVLRGNVESPMTFGLVRPAVFLPRNLPEEDVPMVLRHELCHLRRGDLWYKGLFLLCACVHWFNPLVWKLGKVAGAHLELCCDEDVVAGQDIRFRREYGQLLLRSAAAGGTTVLATRFGGSDLKGRIMNLFTKKKRGGALVCAVTCAALMMSSLVGCEVQAVEPELPAQSAAQSVQAGEGVIREEEAPNTWVELLPSVESAIPAGEEAMLWPVAGKYTLSAIYGGRTHPITGEVSGHNGIDIIADGGTEVLAVRSGVVQQSDFDKQYGNYVLIAHEDGTSTLYAQMKERLVEANDTVAQGQVVGTVGKTGAATGEHLHIEVYRDGKRVDPLGEYPALEFELRMDGQKEPIKVDRPVIFN